MSLDHFPRNKEALLRDQRRDSGFEPYAGCEPFSCGPGLTQVRILPAYSEAGKWYREIKEYNLYDDGHWVLVPSPLSLGDYACPIYQAGRELYASGNSLSIEKAKNLRPRTRYIFNAVVFSEPKGEVTPKKGVVVLKAPKTVKTQLQEFDLDDDYEDITNLKTGRDVKIIRSGEKLNTVYQVMPVPKQTDLQEVLAAQGVDIDNLSLYNLDELFVPPDSSELERLLVSHMNFLDSSYATPGPKVPLSEEGDPESVLDKIKPPVIEE